MSCDVSVILPVKGSDLKAIKESINSILEQSFSGLELIIVNDDQHNSALASVLSKIAAQNLGRVVLLETITPGVANALNMGIKIARGHYIARMDSDDVALPDRINNQFNYMEEHPEVDMLGMQAELINESGQVIGHSKKPLASSIIKSYACYANPLIHPTWFVRKNIFTRIGVYKDMSPAQDYHFVIRALKSGLRIQNLDIIGIRYTVREGSASRTNIHQTLSISRLIRQAMTRNLNIDDGIDRVLADNSSHVVFEKLYSARNHFLKKISVSCHKLNRFFYTLMVIIISALHPLLFSDSIAGFQARRISVKAKK